jgi:hypothetical protein
MNPNVYFKYVELIIPNMLPKLMFKKSKILNFIDYQKLDKITCSTVKKYFAHINT